MTQVLPEPIQFGKYTLYERIGRGGMADVFKGRIQGPAGFERVFVVKRILSPLSDDPTFIKMFVEEAKLSARLNHPNIVQIFELGAVEGEYFISMEHVPGHDLAETMRALWKTAGPPRPDLVAYVGREICRALSYAHGLADDDGRVLGIIHRDVSPSNVMLSFEGAVKLLDFGIAKAFGEGAEGTTKGGTLKGKYAYMAPEQTEGEDVDARIDIFATGIVLHEVLTGRRLFKGANDLQTIERVRRCDVRPPSMFNPSCPPELDAIVLRALAPRRQDRFQNAAEMADALDDVVHAARFTPQHLAAIVRDVFGSEGGAVTGEWRSSAGWSTLPSGQVRSPLGVPALPGIPLPSRRSSARMPVVTSPSLLPPPPSLNAAALQAAILPRPLWRRGSFWAVATLGAVAVGVALAKGVSIGGMGMGTGGGPALAAPATAAESRRATAPKKVKRIPVLVQSEPEGAEIFVSGKLEAVGVTPMWLSLEMDRDNPARIMLRKAGYQDKAVAVEVERPPVVQMLPTGAGSSTSTATMPTAAVEVSPSPLRKRAR